MPWNPAQHRLFEAAAHDPAVAKRVGVPQHQAATMAHEGIKHMAAGGNISIYGGGERIRAPEPTVMGGNAGMKHVRVGSPFRPRWGAKPMAFADGGTVDRKVQKTGQLNWKDPTNRALVTRPNDYGGPNGVPNPFWARGQMQQIPSGNPDPNSATEAYTNHMRQQIGGLEYMADRPGTGQGEYAPRVGNPDLMKVPTVDERGQFPFPRTMADGGAVDEIPSGPWTADTSAAMNNSVGSWRDIPDAAAQAVIGAATRGAGVGGDVEKMFYPKEPNVLPSSADISKYMPQASGSDNTWRDIGGSMPISPGALMKGAAALKGAAAIPFLSTKGMSVAPATLEDFRQALLASESKAPALANNASGESAASLEAMSRNASEDTNQIKRIMIDKNSGQMKPINMVDRADRVPGPNEVHIVHPPAGSGLGKPWVWAQGNNVKDSELPGVLARYLENSRTGTP